MNAPMNAAALEPVEFDPFGGDAVERVIPTSEAQREVWLADRLSPQASLAFNESVRLLLSGPLDTAALRGALDALVARHDALRCTVGPEGTELLVSTASDVALALVDLRALSAEDAAHSVERAAVEAVETPFELEQGPLFRAELFRLNGDRHVLMMTAHHIVCDGWSWGLITDDLGALYAEQIGAAPGPDVAPSYGDYVAWEAAEATTPTMAEHERFWLGRFAGASLPTLDLPTDRPRAPARTFNSRRVDHMLDAALVADVRKLGAKAGASAFATLFSGFAATLHRLTGQDDLVIGVPAAGQSASGMTGLVGHCVNLLPVRTAIDTAKPFDAYVRQSGTTLLDAFDHQTVTYGSLLKKLPLRRDPSRLPLVSVMFNVDQAVKETSSAFPGLGAELTANPRRFENFELFVNAADANGGLRLECQYNTDLFDATTVKRWMATYDALLRAAVAQPEQAIGRLSWLAPAEVAALSALQPARTPVDAELMHSAFVRQAASTPKRVALRDGDNVLSYEALDQRSNRLARALRARGVSVGDNVGLCLNRSADMVVALLAVLKAGGTYIPLDPGFPAGRLAYYAEDAKLSLLLTESSVTTAPLAWCADAAQRVLRLDLDSGWLNESPDALPTNSQDASRSDAAYIIYTSGSTGKPKGVCVPHRAVANFLTSMQVEPGIKADDCLAAVTTLSFDIAVLELMLPLTVGARVVIVPRDTAMDGNLLSELLRSTGATVMQATPGLWRMLLDTSWDGSASFKALVGGESLPPDLARDLSNRTSELWNMYGPTETTVWSTVWRVRPDALTLRGVSIGRPIANTSVWILNDALQPCPIGVPGEICIGGDGVTSGYLDRPDLTADRFVADPFSGYAEAKLYRTGDRGRWRNDGLLEHLGRLDFQVKVRGYRIELGEIETCCNEAAGVAQSVVLAREDNPGDVRLVAYLTLTAGAAFDEAGMRAKLRARLPEYMLPQHVMVLPNIPLLPNGKVDRKALPAPEAPSQTTRSRIAPSTPLQMMVASAMESSLRMPGLSLDDNFFALGGHSLLAAHLAMNLSTLTGCKVPLRAVFDAPTIEALAGWIDAHSDAQHPAPAPIEAASDQSQAPASLMQQRLWFLEQLDPGRLTYNTPSAHRLTGPLDAAALERSFNEMVRRQAVLRTSIVDEDGVPVQRILPALQVSLQPAEDLSAAGPQECELRLMKLMNAEVGKPIDMREAPLFRVRLYRLSDNEHVLFFMPHHVIWDGWSFDLFYEEMAELYGAYSQGREPGLLPLSASYADFSRWQQRWLQSDDLHKQLEHWKQRLTDLPEPLELPLDRQRPPRMSGDGGTHPVACSKDLVERARRFGQSNDATLFMSLLAVYALLLSRVSGQRDVIIGTPVRGRELAHVENVMGFFVNALPLRLHVEAGQNFVELLAHVRGVVLDAFSAPDVPFELLVRETNTLRDESRSPIYQAFFSFQDARQRTRRWGAVQQEQVHLFQPGAAEDLGLWFLEHPGGLAGGLTFNSDVFTSGTARALGERFQSLLDAALADPQRPVGTLTYMPTEEAALLERWNRTEAMPGQAASIPELLQAQARRTPDRAALRSGGKIFFSYADLEARANRLARELRSRGVARGALVGLCLERSPDMLVAQLAILKAGAAYVPLDPAYPVERLAYMAQDAQLALLITHSTLTQALPWPRTASLLLDLDHATLEAHSGAAMAPDTERDATASDPAYVIYTSGSTGKPKGVVVPHDAVLNFLASMAREPGLGPDDRLLAVTTLSFDIAVLELLLPLSVGAQVVLASREEAQDGVALRALLDTGAATVMQATPSTWRMLIEAGWPGTPGLKALIGGEGLPTDLAQALVSRCDSLWNMYGPTETTVWSTCWKVEHAAQRISIGRPIANTKIHILDEQGQTCAIGVPGEICIGGRGVTLGYLGRADLTAERFVADSSTRGARLYRTGDRGRWCHDGLLEHLGRMDLQVKVRGHRIELGEIESNLSSHPQVTQAVVMVREVRPGDLRLVGYVVGKTIPPSANDLRAHLRLSLPDYMVPQHFVSIDRVPLLPNGKIDRKALPAPSESIPAPSVAPAETLSATEQAIAEVWQDELGIGDVRADDNFFNLGGHSLIAVRVVMEMERRLGIKVDLRRLIFESLSQIAKTPVQASAPGGSTASRPGLFGRLMRAIKPPRSEAGPP